MNKEHDLIEKNPCHVPSPVQDKICATPTAFPSRARLLKFWLPGSLGQFDAPPT
jgi:hypothetical protein